MLPFLRHNWFLIALTALFAYGAFAYQTLEPLSKQPWLRSLTVATAMFLMALPLEAGAFWNAIRRPWATLLAVAVTFGLLPLIAWMVSPLVAEEFRGGLLVAAITPCTMASATVWTRKAGGNDSAATMVTVVTNLACFLVMPAWLLVLTGQKSELPDQNFSTMVGKLLITVVLPVVAAQLFRLLPGVSSWAAQKKTWLGLGSQLCILFMAFIGAIQTGQRIAEQSLHSEMLFNLIGMVATVLLVHVAAFWLGLGLARALRLTWPDQVAVAFAGSQKTLMVGMEVALASGFSVLPIVTYHVGQLFIDTVFADRLRQWSLESSSPPKS